MSTTGDSKLFNAAATAAGLVALESSTSVTNCRVALPDDERFGCEVGTVSYRIASAHQREVSFALSLEYAKFVGGILLEGGVPIQVVGPHVEERRHLEAGAFQVVELERGDLQY